MGLSLSVRTRGGVLRDSVDSSVVDWMRSRSLGNCMLSRSPKKED